MHDVALKLSASDVTLLAAVVAAAAAVIGAGLAAWATLTSTTRANRHAHKQWQRERRLQAYSNVGRIVTQFLGAVRNHETADIPSIRAEYNRAVSEAIVLGPEAVAKKLRVLGGMLREVADDPTRQPVSSDSELGKAIEELGELFRQVLEKP